MAMFIRLKRVPDPLDERVKARLLSDDMGHASSGSEHKGADISSLSGLVDAVFNFDEPSLNESISGCSTPDNCDLDSIRNYIQSIAISLHDLLRSCKNSELHSDITESAIALSGPKDSGSMHRRRVMARLRENGYNVGICKSKWVKSGGLTAGSYEYIDIVLHEERYIVDLEFNEQFKVARASEEYERLVEVIPRIMVGRVEEVKRVVVVMAEVSKKMVESGGLSFAPWRKRRYLMNKWFGDYKRTTNATLTVNVRWLEVDQCRYRAVGFLVGKDLLVRI